MDSGDIISQQELIINDEDTTESLFDKLSIMGANLLIETLPSIFNNTNNRIKQDESLVTYAYNIKREDEKVDFNDTGKNIINKIRGLYSWPLANFTINNLEYKVYDAYFEECSVLGPGVIKVDKNNFKISCKDGMICITRIKPFGKKEMVIKDFINGIDKEEYNNKEVNK